MLFRDLFGSPDPKSEPVFSFEIFPPKTEAGLQKLESRIPRLIELSPAFISVTYGAMGSTQQRTLEIASTIQNQYGQTTAQHLTCVGADKDVIRKTLDNIRVNNIQNIVALRGDPPLGQSSFQPPPGGLAHADELVQYIRKTSDFGIAVAGYPEKHPEASSFDSDLHYLKRKADLGADVIITQLFYDNSSYGRYLDMCRDRGIEQPIVPGLMPILDLAQIKRITEMCHSSIPQKLGRRLEAVQDDPLEVQKIGVEHTVNQAIELLGMGAPGIHFYVLNRSSHISEIMAKIRAFLAS